MKRISLCLIAALLMVILSACTALKGSLITKETASNYYEIAEGYAGITKYDKAISFYRKAALQKEFANAANYGLARMYSLTGKWQDACVILGDLYAQDKENTLIATAYAYALASNSRGDEALALYESVWKKNSEDPSAGRNYAGILFLSGKFGETLEQIALLKEKYPDAEALKGIDELEKKAKEGLSPPAEPDPAAGTKADAKTDVITDAKTVPEKPESSSGAESKPLPVKAL